MVVAYRGNVSLMDETDQNNNSILLNLIILIIWGLINAVSN